MNFSLAKIGVKAWLKLSNRVGSREHVDVTSNNEDANTKLADDLRCNEGDEQPSFT